MGGIGSSLFEKAGAAAEKGGEFLVRKAEGTSLGRGALNLFGNDSWELGLTPESKAVESMANSYEHIRATSLGESLKPHKEIQEFIKNDAGARANINPKTATIQDIHNYAARTNHPIQVSTKKLLDMHLDPTTGVSNAADKTLETVDYQNKAKAKLDGVAGSFGDKYQNLNPLLASLQTNPDPRINIHGERVLDIVSNILRDTRKDAQGKQYSAVKAAVAQAFETVNKITGGAAGLIPPKVGEITYHPPTAQEQAYKAILRTIQLPAILLPHLTQFAHLPAVVPMKVWSDRIFAHDPIEVQRVIDISATMSNTQYDILHNDILYNTGKIAQWTGSPTAGRIINKMFHQPGFLFMRNKQLSFTASLGFHSAIHWAAEAVKGNKRAFAELDEMGIDVKDVLKQNGKLDDEQLAKGIFHFTNNKMFFSRPLDQSLYMNRNFLTRSMFMYHSFLNSETAFIRRELLKMSKTGDVAGIAQFVGVLGVAVPAVMPMLKSAEILARTGSPSQAGDEIKKDYSNLLGGGGASGFADTYIDMISMLGGIGIFKNYMQAIKGNMLLNAAVGPMISEPWQLASDAVNAIRGKSAKPIARDVLTDIPVVGRPLAHTFAPTTKEAPSGGGRLRKFRPHVKRR